MDSHSVASLEHWVWYLICVGFALLPLRLYVGKLARTYKYLAVFAGTQLLQNLVLMRYFHPSTMETYFLVYVFSSPVIWLAYILMVLELYNSALQRYAGIATLSRRMLQVVLVVAILGAMVTLLPDMRLPEDQLKQQMYQWVAKVSLIERGVVSSLVIFLLIISGLLLWFPVRITRNAVTHTVLCCIFFLGIDASLFVRDISSFEPTSTRLASTVMMGVATMCLFLWSILLKQKHESLQMVIRPAFRSAEGGETAARQLEAINAALLRITRK